MIGIIIYALFVFWSCGVISVLIDIDHIFVLFGRKSPIKFSESYGRPFHSRVIFTLVAFFISICMATFINGFYRGILSQFGIGGTILFLIILIIITGIIVKKVGKNFGIRLRKQRRYWRKKYLENNR